MADPIIDPETLKRRREMASRLFQAREKGLTREQALSSEAGLDEKNLTGMPDMAFGTNLTEQQISAFANRLYAGKYDQAQPQSVFDRQEIGAQKRAAASGAFGGPTAIGKSSLGQPATPNLDRLAKMQSEPIGSNLMGATGGLGKGPSKTGGTPLGGADSSFKIFPTIAAGLMDRAQKSAQREISEAAAKEGARKRSAARTVPASPIDIKESSLFSLAGTQQKKAPFL